MRFLQKLSQWTQPGPAQYGKLPIDDQQEENKERRDSSPAKVELHAGLYFWRYLLVLLLGLCLGFAISIPFLLGILPHHHQEEQRQWPPIIPRQVFEPRIPTSWVPDERYIGFSEYTSLMWHHLVKTTESVWISDPANHGLGAGFSLPKGNHTQAGQFYHVSNLHQLHCLKIVRERYMELQLDLPSISKQSEALKHETAYHVDHCIEYLRMTIMCGRSWDIESNSPPGTPPDLTTDPFGHPLGWGGVRDCVNWETLITWQGKQLKAFKESELKMV